GQPGQGPGAGVVPADVAEDAGAAARRLRDPGGAAAGGEGGDGGPGVGRAGGGGLLGGRFVAVGDHGALALVGHGHGDRGVPAGDGAGGAEVDALALLEGVPAVLAVVVVAEGRREGGAQAEAGQGGGHVGDAAGAGAHAARPGLGAAHGGGVEAGEDDVEEDGAGEVDVAARIGGGGQGGQRVEVGAAVRPTRPAGGGVVAASVSARHGGRHHDALPDMVRIRPVCTTAPTSPRRSPREPLPPGGTGPGRGFGDRCYPATRSANQM